MNADDAERALLRQGSRELGVVLDESQCSDLLRYVERIYVWNRAAGLTTIARGDAVRLHLLDSVAAVPAVLAAPCADLGTGAGLPGLVLAIARPDLEIHLVESNRKKVSFLHETVRELGIRNARIVERDAHAVGERFPTVISRAFRQPREFVSIATKLVTAGGRLVLLMADPADEELHAIGPTESCLRYRRFCLPGGVERRTVVTYDLRGQT
jgi:16S rRNA (guanine527-N7)-methyltransferase